MMVFFEVRPKFGSVPSVVLNRRSDSGVINILDKINCTGEFSHSIRREGVLMGGSNETSKQVNDPYPGDRS